MDAGTLGYWVGGFFLAGIIPLLILGTKKAAPWRATVAVVFSIAVVLSQYRGGGLNYGSVAGLIGILALAIPRYTARNP